MHSATKGQLWTKASVSVTTNLEQTTLSMFVCHIYTDPDKPLTLYAYFHFWTVHSHPFHSVTIESQRFWECVISMFLESKQDNPTLNAKQQFYYNTQDFFLLLRSLPARHINTRGTGWHQNTMNVRHEVGEKVIINEPTWTQVGQTLVQSSLVLSRFNLKHKQRPDPSKNKKACSSSKQWEQKQKSTCKEQSHKVKMEFL